MSAQGPDVTILVILVRFLGQLVTNWQATGVAERNSLVAAVVIEAVGIWFTVYVLDRRARERERARWLPLRYRVYARMAAMCDTFMGEVVPERFWDSVPKYYWYDDEAPVRARVDCEVKEGLTQEQLLPAIDRSLAANDVSVRSTYKCALTKVKVQIDRILDKYAAVLDPETLRVVWDVQQHLEELAPVDHVGPEDYAAQLDKMHQEDFASELSRLSLRIIDLRQLMVGKATREERVFLGKVFYTREELPTP